MSTVRQIAIEAGVSPITVSRALRDAPKVSEETRTRIKAIAKRLGYRTNPLVSGVMRQLKLGQKPVYRCGLGLIVPLSAKRWIDQNGTLGQFRAGAMKRAQDLGFSLETYWIDAKGSRSRQLQRNLTARGVQGLIIAKTDDFPAECNLDWSRFALCAEGFTPPQPSCDRVCTNFVRGMHKALDELLLRGYSRPGLAIMESVSQDNECIWESMISAYYADCRSEPRIPSLVKTAWESADFLQWFKRYKPDVVLTLRTSVINYLKTVGINVPEHAGILKLSIPPDSNAEWSGLDWRHDMLGAAAIDVLSTQLLDGSRGEPKSPRVTMISPVWIEGNTLRPARQRSLSSTPQIK